jgi:NAD(P)-dependent dehydrogenase (short-subunit alcohol dehydrogenase family)
MKQKIILTGAAGGFGVLIAQSLLRNGHEVVAAMRDLKGRNRTQAAELQAGGAHVAEMDVTDDRSVDDCVQAAIRHLSAVDVVINNAGIGVLGLQEAFTTDDWKRLFEVNVFGVQRVCRAILPHMRAKHGGLILNISSLLGRITVPFYGPYNASKWALEAMSENYRSELSQFGIEVCIVEPGGYATGFIDNLMRPGDPGRTAGYGEFGQMPEGFLKGFEHALASNPAQDPKNVATAVLNVIQAPKGQKPFRTIVDNMGMGDPIEGYNQQLSQVTKGIYSAFGIGHLLDVKQSPQS